MTTAFSLSLIGKNTPFIPLKIISLYKLASLTYILDTLSQMWCRLMEILRKGESGTIPFRTGRFFTVESKWFFSSREGIDHGPFTSKEQAEISLGIFLDNVMSVETKLKA